MASTSIRARNLAAAISMALASAGMHAATITVDSADDDPASMACNLRGALKAINNGSTLAVPACSAAVSGDSFGIDDTIVLAGLSPITLTQGALTVTASSVTIDGSGTIPPSGAAPTAADFYQPYQVIDAAGGSRVLGVADGVTLSANSLMLTGGQTTGNGGGISIGTGATVTLNNCSISSNVTTAEGGAIYAAPSSTLKLVDSIVSGNASFAGGALFANDSTVTVTNTSIAYNEANYGGGVYSLSGALNLEKASIYGNTGRTYTGGVFVINAALTMANSRVFANSGGRAGGMFLSGASGTLTTSTIDGNTAKCFFACGGAMLLDNSMLAVTGSTFSGNLAAGLTTFVTGGVNLFGSTATFVNSTISGNVGAGRDSASGAFSQDHLGGNTSLTLINTTVTHNTAAAVYGTAVGGVLIATPGLSPPPLGYDTFTAQNTVISGNAPADKEVVFDEFSTSLAVQYSLLGSTLNTSAFNDPANHNIFSDSPGLGPLDDNGGPTKTHALLPGSPALSAGSTALAMFSGQALDFDQRGPDFLRIVGGAVDIGAFEDQTDQLFADGFESEP